MEQHGVMIGVALLCAVTLVSFLLAAKAARSVNEFCEDHHENFLGRGDHEQA